MVTVPGIAHVIVRDAVMVTLPSKPAVTSTVVAAVSERAIPSAAPPTEALLANQCVLSVSVASNEAPLFTDTVRLVGIPGDSGDSHRLPSTRIISDCPRNPRRELVASPASRLESVAGSSISSKRASRSGRYSASSAFSVSLSMSALVSAAAMCAPKSFSSSSRFCGF